MLLWELNLFPEEESENAECYIVVSSIEAANEAEDRDDDEGESKVFVGHVGYG